jgi:hypothetical protein
MGALDNLRYETKLFELEDERWNYFVYVSTRAGERWSQNVQIGSGSADSETQAVEEAQEKATDDRREREKEMASTKVVPLK